MISPEAVASVTCLKEIAYASAKSKRVIPVLYREVPGSAIPRALADINWCAWPLAFNWGQRFPALRPQGCDKLVEGAISSSVSRQPSAMKDLRSVEVGPSR